MAFDDIVKQIADDAAAEVAEVRRAAEAETRATLDRADRDAAALREDLMRRAHQRAAERGERLRTLAELEHRKAVLAEKQKALHQAFDQAAERIAALPPDRAKALLKAVIVERVETGREEIVPGREHAALFDDAFVREINAALGERGRLTLAAAPGDFPHGVVLREGRKEINARLSVLLAESRDALSHRIAAVLFPEDGEPRG